MGIVLLIIIILTLVGIEINGRKKLKNDQLIIERLDRLIELQQKDKGQ
ncbi:hypothetical protein [Paenibacillus sp. GCM10027626]